MENPNFLKKKYWSREVKDSETGEKIKPFVEATERSAVRARQKDESIPSNPSETIKNHLNRLEKVIAEKGKLFKHQVLYRDYVIKSENISDNYIKGVILGNFAEQRGYDRSALKDKETREKIIEQFEAETGQKF
jgi:hypothetical protein